VSTGGSLLAISDLHAAYKANRKIISDLRPETDEDWLIVAGDVGEILSDIEWTLRLLSGRFAKVIWTPGNHELWTPRSDPVRLRGEHRYRRLVELCRGMDVATPEDPYLVWRGAGGPVTVAPLFVLYDYTFRLPGLATKEEALKGAYDAGVVCTDEFQLHPDPHPTLDAWCGVRVDETERLLAARDESLPTILVSHFPLVRDPTRVLHHPEFALWCGTERTADWHRRYNAVAAVYGHLHIPRTTWHDGVRFEEVSLGYPREWEARQGPPGRLRRILPAEATS
jgi:3',5'-cyclic AMP phosphodiesterase CpdA